MHIWANPSHPYVDVCFTYHAHHKYYLQSLTNAGVFGQGNFDLVREISGNFAFYNVLEP